MSSKIQIVIFLSVALLISNISISYGQSTGISYVINEGTVLQYHVNFEPPSIVFNIETFGEAKLIVKIPRNLLDARDGQNDIDFKVKSDADQISNFSDESSKDFRTLTIQVPVGSSKITIVGTELLNLPTSKETDLIRINTFPNISNIHSPHIRENEWNIEVVMDGVYQDNGRIFVVISGHYSSNYPSNEYVVESYIREGNRIAIMDVSHPSNSYLTGTEYDLTVIHGEYSKTVKWIPLPREPELKIDLEGKERYVKVINWQKAKLENRWTAWLELCAGKSYLTSPILQVTSDIETRQKEVFKIIQPGSCIRGDFTVFAKDPKTISVSFLEKIDPTEMHDVRIQVLEDRVIDLKNEIKDLKLEVAKKDEIIKEQIKTIENLAMKIKNIIFNLLPT